MIICVGKYLLIQQRLADSVSISEGSVCFTPVCDNDLWRSLVTTLPLSYHRSCKGKVHRAKEQATLAPFPHLVSGWDNISPVSYAGASRFNVSWRVNLSSVRLFSYVCLKPSSSSSAVRRRRLSWKKCNTIEVKMSHTGNVQRPYNDSSRWGWNKTDKQSILSRDSHSLPILDAAGS